MVKRMFAVRKLVRVYFDATQYAQIEAKAHGNVSAYLRDLALREEQSEASPIPDVRPTADVRSSARRESMPNSVIASLREQMPELKTANELPRGRVCAHGTKQGYACWQCGGKAKIEQ